MRDRGPHPGPGGQPSPLEGAHAPQAERGLQAERTRLAWRRTGTALALAAVVLGRLALPTLGYAALVAAAVVLACIGWMLLAASRRTRLSTPPGADPRLADSILRDGTAPTLVTAVVVALAALELAAGLLRRP